MSQQFKRAFLSPYSPFPLHKHHLPPPDRSTTNSFSPVSSSSGLHLCRGTSVVCDHIDILKENQHPAGKTSQKKEQSPQPRLPLQSISEAALPASPPKISRNSVECKDYGEKIALLPPPSPNHPLHVWDDPGYDVAPASSWSTVANRTLLCRPLPLDVGRCACYVVREHEEGVDSPTVYSLYTDEGQGREDRRLAIARHRRRGGRSEFIVAQRSTANLAKYEDEFLGRVRSNLVGSRYFVWEQANSLGSEPHQGRRQLLGIITFEPTVTTLTGTYRVMKACIPKYQSIQMNNCCIQPEKNGMTKDKEENIGKVHQLCSRKPTYNRETKRYELDFRDRSRRGCKIKTSVKNFQLIMEETGKQVIMQFGKIGKSKYMMEYRFPLTGYQAFSICLASMDSKLCCSI